MMSSASAETLVRAQGRCKLTSSNYRVFDGHCIVKQKQQGNTMAFVVELDNDSKYRFYGPNKDSLQVEAYDGIHNVRFDEQPDKGVFTWQVDRETNRLSVRLDSQQPANVTHDDQKTSAGTVLAGAAVGALIGAMLGTHRTSSSSSNSPFGRPVNVSSTNVRIGEPVDNLADFVGARAGQAESDLRDRGYEYRRANQQADSAISYWLETRTRNCVAIRTTDGRYAAIIYAEKFNCR
ncbi:hypothetical protein F7734_02200 [Scytonema sp. UIC 10036]|nr:hypothetical protein [Scytonema sp. UIC 10036]